MAWDMPEPCKFPSPDTCHERFLWTNKEVDLAPHWVQCHSQNWNLFMELEKEGSREGEEKKEKY